MLERLHELTSGFGRAEWHVVGVLATERKLPRSSVERALAETSAIREPTGTWLESNLRRGLLVDAGEARLPLSTRRTDGERALAVASELRALVLRRLAEQNELDQVRRLARALSGEQSLSSFVTALYSGDLRGIELALPDLKRRLVGDEQGVFARGALRDAVCSGFDAASFERTWGEAAAGVAEQVLRDALLTFEPVDPAYAWALARAGSTSETLRAVLVEHALLRGDCATLLDLGVRPAGMEALARSAAGRFACGDLARAEQLLNDSDAWRAQREPSLAGTASVSAVLALIALGRGTSDGLALARRVVRRSVDVRETFVREWPAVSPVEAASRALRTLIRQLGKPEAERTRFDAHQLPAHAPAWETLLLALTTFLHEQSPVKRTAWARRLRAAGKRWEPSYPWFARQAFAVAIGLRDPELDPLDDVPAPIAGELLIADLIQPRPEWRKSLEALAAFAKTAERSPGVVSRRVAWFVDMTRGELTKPALEEYREGTGWVRGRRQDAAELWEHREELPLEDVAVLIAARQGGPAELGPEALTALAGHPRVFDGARGRKPIEVVRGTCRIETRHEHGHVIVAVEPRGAVEGTNVVLEGDSRVVVYQVSAQMAKLTALLPTGMRIPESHEQEALAVLARLSEHVEIRTDRLGAHRSVAADSTPCLRISSEAGAFWVEAGVRPFGALGRFFQPGVGRTAITAHIGDELLESVRDPEEERRRFAELVERCPCLIAATAREAADTEEVSEPAPVYSFALSEESLLDLLLELRESTVRCELEWKSGQPLSARGRVTSSNLNGSLRPVKGWYLVQGSVRIDDVTELALSELVEMPFTKSGRFVRLPTGDFAQVEQRVRHILAALRASAQPGAQGELRVHRSAFETLRTLTGPNSGFDIDAAATAWLALVDSVEVAAPSLPQGLKATLRPYQVEGYRWLARASELGVGVCLADDMGLGKTLQVLALLLKRAADGPALVVAPTSVCSNWIDEIARFAPELEAVEYVGKGRAALLAPPHHEATARAASVVVVSYALLQQDAEQLGSVEWNTVVLDEAQFIKNPTSLRARAAFALRAGYRVAMTGTPIENHLGDLWSIFHFLNEQLLGSWKQFQLRYAKPIERDQDAAQKAALRSLIQPFVLRRRKDEVLAELPPVTTVRHEVRLSEDEALRYAVLRRQIHEKLRTSHGKRQHKLQIFSEITRLRRFCCHPRLVFPEASTESSKVDTFLALVEELRDNGHRALVFSQFVDFLDIVREQLDERGIRYLHLDGSTPREARRARVAAFQAGEADLFLISLKAGGFGLNLTAADYVIHLDPWWNPAVEAQATDRAHRIGQERPVTVYRLITKDTIEERIVELHAEKRLLADAVLQGASEAPARLGIEELRELLGPVSFRD